MNPRSVEWHMPVHLVTMLRSTGGFCSESVPHGALLWQMQVGTGAGEVMWLSCEVNNILLYTTAVQLPSFRTICNLPIHYSLVVVCDSESIILLKCGCVVPLPTNWSLLSFYIAQMPVTWVWPHALLLAKVVFTAGRRAYLCTSTVEPLYNGHHREPTFCPL